MEPSGQDPRNGILHWIPVNWAWGRASPTWLCLLIALLFCKDALGPLGMQGMMSYREGCT